MRVVLLEGILPNIDGHQHKLPPEGIQHCLLAFNEIQIQAHASTRSSKVVSHPNTVLAQYIFLLPYIALTLVRR